MNTQPLSLKKITAAGLPLIIALTISGCGGNKGELAGSWQVRSAFISDPPFDKFWLEVSDKVSSHSYNQVNADYRRYKAMEDSLTAVRKAKVEFYAKSAYQFNGDGTVVIKRESGDVQATWTLEEGTEKMYVEIKTGDQLLERWQLMDDAFNIYLYEEKREIYADVNYGGPFVKENYNANLTLVKREE